MVLVFLATFQAFIITYIVCIAFSRSFITTEGKNEYFFILGTTIYTFVIIVANIKVLLVSNHFSIFFVLSVFLGIISYVISFLVIDLIVKENENLNLIYRFIFLFLLDLIKNNLVFSEIGLFI